MQSQRPDILLAGLMQWWHNPIKDRCRFLIQLNQPRKTMMTLFAAPVFDATVIVEGNELFKGKGSAVQWAARLAVEVGSEVTAQKIGNGWALCGHVDGIDCVWGIYGQRLKRIN
jgi:hypothetical protein